MADNVEITQGSGKTVATDEVTDATLGSVQVQYVKIMDGDIDSTTKYGGSNSFPVDASGTRLDVQRVHNVVDGTITVADVTAFSARPDINRVHNIVDGTVSVGRPDINRVHNVVDGTITVASITARPDVQRVHNVVDGTMSVSDVVSFSARPDINRVFNVVDGTISLPSTQDLDTITRVDRVINLVDGTISVFTARPDINRVHNVVDGTISIPKASFGGIGHTASIGTASGSSTGSSVSGITIVSPEASRNIKVFAYSLQTTGVLANALTFCNGSGASQTEFWRPLATSDSPADTTDTPLGANLAVTPPGYLFACGTNTTLALAGNNGATIHYSVAYIKESA